MAGSSIASVMDGAHKYPKRPNLTYSYGTAGFRTRLALLCDIHDRSLSLLIVPGCQIRKTSRRPSHVLLYIIYLINLIVAFSLITTNANEIAENTNFIIFMLDYTLL